MTHTYEDFLARLDELGVFHMDLSLDRMAAFVKRAGQPGFPVLHVVGTNGKGSTSTVLAELLSTHGLRVGLFLSPHFVSVRERVLVDGAMLSEETWARLGARAFELAEGLGLTYFEVLTAVALLAFQEAGCGVAVMEAGLGGRFDATNVLNPALTVFTPIAMDHMNVLGDTLEKIAEDKAGAMRPDAVAVSAPQEPAAWAVLEARAAAVGAELVPATEVLRYSRRSGRVEPGGHARYVRTVRHIDEAWLALAGAHQEQNARTALAAFHVLAARMRLPVSADACREALRRAFIPGRMQIVADAPGLPSLLILDGGHNAHGLAALKRSLEDEGIRPVAVVVGCLRDKPLDRMLPLVRAIAGEAPAYAVGIPSCPRALGPGELAVQLGSGSAPDVHWALKRLQDANGPVLVCGSLYLLGEFYTQHPWLLERRQAVSDLGRFRQ